MGGGEGGSELAPLVRREPDRKSYRVTMRV